ncbi:kinase-like protein, partial [Mycena rebaudengoi]
VTPAHCYAEWVAAAVTPLEEFIDHPRDVYAGLREIVEGESGSVFAAELAPDAPVHLSPLIKSRDLTGVETGAHLLLVDVRREPEVLRHLWCEHVLGMDAVSVEDALWIQMERSLASWWRRLEAAGAEDYCAVCDVSLHAAGARLFLQKHRDLRSDNRLLNSEGVLKLSTSLSPQFLNNNINDPTADFSNAVQVKPESPRCANPVGVLYWQAPEDTLKVGVWSVSATVWGLVEARPPFSDTELSVSEPALYPPAFREFLRLCSEPAEGRMGPGRC